jgi:tRNA C32,U32 (ribose-2'-O)-methylase TrmJ
MVMAYQIYSTVFPGASSRQDLAPSEELEALFRHLEQSLDTLGFREWNDGENYLKSLRRVFSRTRLERRDVAAVHKLCGEIDRYARRVRTEFEEKYRK